MDFSKYKFRMNIKACCLYEQITGNNFLRLSTEEDVFKLIYCCLVSNNPGLLMTYKVFQTLMQDKKVNKWVMKEYERISEFNAQIMLPQIVEKEEKKKEDAEPEEITLTDVASTLIIRYGMDAQYVMYDMELWEIQPYFNAADIQRKNDLVTQRFWTYLTIAPNIDTKKVKSPGDLVPFEWEETKKDRIKKRMEADTNAAASFLLNNRKKEKEDGES